MAKTEQSPQEKLYEIIQQLKAIQKEMPAVVVAVPIEQAIALLDDALAYLVEG